MKELELWIQNWLGNDSETLEPKDWFELGHDIRGYAKDLEGYEVPHVASGKFIWTPPPWVARAALEELRKARIKRQESIHVVVVPKLATP
mmetsp:Transcript_3333/g.5084  ORF Transcript_3333/g.5084 Transcript_3333/m.5084 type:complete len:90 (-) Transcript_3333:257-526(-)